MIKWQNQGDKFKKEIPITKRYSIQITIEDNAVKMFIWNSSSYNIIDGIVSLTKPKPISFLSKLLRRKEPLSLEEQVFNTFNALKQKIHCLEGSTEDPLVTE